MINSESDILHGEAGTRQEAALTGILKSGATGAVVLAGLATAVVVAIWLAFYLLVFVPRALTP
jgi:hypothetical protein